MSKIIKKTLIVGNKPKGDILVNDSLDYDYD